MTRQELLTLYRKQSKNFMTPNVMAKRILPARFTVIELSEGKGLNHQAIYGVSVLCFKPDGERDYETERSNPHLGMYSTKEEAFTHYQDA